MKLKLCIRVHDISLYIQYVFLLLLHMCFCCYGNLSFHRLIMGKVEIGIYFFVTADILTKVLQKCSWSSPLQTIWILSKSLVLIGCHGNRNVKFLKKKKSKIFFSEVIGGMKLKLCINVCVIICYINYFFYCCCASGFVIMGKVKVGLYFCLTFSILTKALQYCSLSSPLTTIRIKSKLLNLISCHGKWKFNFSCMQNLQYFGWI